jgi:hypothetical protein
MPKHDGTGPKGAGPMTGRGLGLCVLKIPCTKEEPFTGFAGESGREVCFFPEEEEPGPDEDARRETPGDGRIEASGVMVARPVSENTLSCASIVSVRCRRRMHNATKARTPRRNTPGNETERDLPRSDGRQMARRGNARSTSRLSEEA